MIQHNVWAKNLFMYEYHTFKWWKSCASGEGRRGKWYPLCETVVVRTAIEVHSHVVIMWEFIRRGPTKTGNKFESMCSTT